MATTKSTRKGAAKSARSRKARAKKSGVKKSGVKKSSAKKSSAKKSGVKKSSAKKSGVKKTTGGKAPAAVKRKGAGQSIASAPPAAAPSKPVMTGAGAKALERKPLASALGPRKTARSRLASKRAPLEAHSLARKSVLRASLPRRGAGRARPMEESSPTAQARQFDPALLTFRAAARQDFPAIRRLLIESFGRAGESELVERLRASRDVAAEFIAEHESRLVGYVGFCGLLAKIDGRAIRAAGLAPLAVAGEVERRGVATRLVVYGLENVRGQGFSAVFVLGEPGFFGRFGFSARLARRFQSEWAGPSFQALEFEPGVLRGSHGEAIWPAAFSLL